MYHPFLVNVSGGTAFPSTVISTTTGCLWMSRCAMKMGRTITAPSTGSRIAARPRVQRNVVPVGHASLGGAGSHA